MAHHGRAGKNSIPAGNVQKTAPDVMTDVTARKKARGRTAQTNHPDQNVPNAREGNVLQERLTEANNPIGRGGGKMRGDRQHTTPDPGIRGQKGRIGKRDAGVNRGLRNDRNPQGTAGRKRNRVPNEGG